MTVDDIARTNREHWERQVEEGCGFTIPWLDLNIDTLRWYLDGELAPLPEDLIEMYPAHLLHGIAGKDVLCLASGGGQQSAVFGLLGARVTVIDLTEGQLAGDRAAAAHHGYAVTTHRCDMRDLSCLADGSFDLVWQAPSLAYVPDVRPVFAEVARILRPGGIYRTEFDDPAIQFVDPEHWNGEGYSVTVPYSQKRGPDVVPATYRHYMKDIFNGLIAEGLVIREVTESPHRFLPLEGLEPGGWDHWLRFLGGQVCVVSRKD